MRHNRYFNNLAVFSPGFYERVGEMREMALKLATFSL